MRHLPLRECGYAVGFILAIMLLYGGAYLGMMERIDLGISSIAGEETPMVAYRFGGDWSESFFAPAHEIDRQLRPDLWKGERRHVRQWSPGTLRPIKVSPHAVAAAP